MTDEQIILNKEIEKLKKIKRTKDVANYALTQCILGSLYSVGKSDSKQAEKYFKKVLRKDNPRMYALAQYSLGRIFYFHSENSEKNKQAEKYYKKVLKEDNPRLYAKAQCHLGSLLFEKNKYKYACKHYEKVCFDDQYSYYKAQLYLALINNKDYNLDSNIINSLLANLKKIDESIVNIKNALLVKLDPNNNFERKFAHYTKPEVLFNFLNKGSKMRLSLVDLMNDPTENKILVNWLNINTNQYDNKIKTFVTSFSFNHNSLNQFRLYGLEDNVNGSGISIVFNKEFFNKILKKEEINYEKITNNQIKEEVMKETINSKDTNNGIFPLSLYRCVYFDPESKYIKIAKRNKQSFYREFLNEDDKEIENKWEEYIEYIKEVKIVEEIRKNLKEIKESTENSINKIIEMKKNYLLSVFEELIYLAIMPISCLIKHSAFEDEQECRITYTTHISDELIIGPDSFQTINTTLYLDYSEVNGYINKIYLGPKCKIAHQKWIEHSTGKLEGIKVQNSTLPFQ